jgi:hypothetical protein
MATVEGTVPIKEPVKHNEKLIITASSLGTVFEWYDFYLYGLLTAIIAAKFLTGLNPTTSFIMALLVFAAGFIVRPFGALVFGRIGDMVGRRYTFIVTLLVMGLSTFLVGCLPTYETVGVAAPIMLVVLRMFQGLALGGEYGGAARTRPCWQTRAVHKLDPDHGNSGPCDGAADRDPRPFARYRRWRRGVPRLGLARALPAFGRVPDDRFVASFEAA